MSTGIVDYRSTFFEQKIITKIHGEPSYDAIKRLHNELKANAGRVPSNLGGGMHGHLALVLSPTQYAMISNTPFVRPAHPGPFFYPPGTSDINIRLLRDNHAEATRVFREVVGVDNALRAQIVEAVEPQFLTALRNRQTNAINLPTHQILQFLYDEYGRVTPQMLQDQETKLKNMAFDPTQPIDSLFTAIEELCDLAEAGGTPYTPAQCVNIAYVIINNTGCFTNAIREWIRKPTNQRSWVQFKIDFRRAQKEYKECTRHSAQDANFSANMIQEIVDGIKQELRGMQEEYSYTSAPPVNDFYTANHSISPTTTTSQSSIVSSLQEEIQSLRSMIETLRPIQPTMPSHTSTQSSVTSHNNFANQTVLKTKSGKELKYCWTHGIGTHDSKECHKRANGHQEQATAQNIMNGSTKGVNRYLRKIKNA